MDFAWKRGTGAAVRWLHDHANYSGDDCLIWPFSTVRGYGNFGHLGKHLYAHRYMCELVNGPPPTPKHQAAHTCGKGDCGCVNPRHLVWKTPSGNQLDRYAHGTFPKTSRGTHSRLSREQWDEIKSLAGRVTQAAVAQKYGISLRQVRRIQNSGGPPPAVRGYFDAAEVEYLTDAVAEMKPWREIADRLGRKIDSVQQKARHLGLHAAY